MEKDTLTFTQEQFGEKFLKPFLEGYEDENNKENYTIEERMSDEDESIDIEVDIQTKEEYNDENEYCGAKALENIMYESWKGLNEWERENIFDLAGDVNSMSDSVDNYWTKDMRDKWYTLEALGDIDVKSAGSEIDEWFLAMLSQHEDYGTVGDVLSNDLVAKIADRTRDTLWVLAYFLANQSNTVLIGGILSWFGQKANDLRNRISSWDDIKEEEMKSMLEDMIEDEDGAKEKIDELAEQFRLLRFCFQEKRKSIEDKYDDEEAGSKIEELEKKKLSESFGDMELSNQTEFDLKATKEAYNLNNKLENKNKEEDNYDAIDDREWIKWKEDRQVLHSYSNFTRISSTTSRRYEVGADSGVYADTMEEAVWLANLANKLDSIGRDYRRDRIDGHIRSRNQLIPPSVQRIMVRRRTLRDYAPSLSDDQIDRFCDYVSRRT